MSESSYHRRHRHGLHVAGTAQVFRTAAVHVKMCTGCCSVDETITVEEKDTQIKPTEAVERLEATPGEQSSTKSPPGPLFGSSALTIAAEAGGSARDILADIRSKRGIDVGLSLIHISEPTRPY